MVRKSLVLLSTIAVVLAVYTTPASATRLTGTAECTHPANFGAGTFTPPLPGQTPSVSRTKFLFSADLGTCQASNEPALAIARVSLKDILPRGTDCVNEYTNSEANGGAFHLIGAKVKIAWLGVDGQHYSSSKARVTSITLSETYVMTMVSGPIRGGSFKDRTITLDATVRNLGDLAAQCGSPTGLLSFIDFAPVALHVA
jgi:hypothetical protein